MNYRTVGIFAHIDSGKTTLTERILYEAGKISAIGSIEDGTTESDQLKEEIERGISIRSTFHSLKWKSPFGEIHLQIIDTPGHIDFRNQVTDLLPSIDIAILVLDGGSPVQSQARLVLEELKQAKLPVLVFINKLDRFREDYLDTLVSLESILGVPASELFQRSDGDTWDYFLSKPDLFSRQVMESLFYWNDDFLLQSLENPNQSISLALEGLRLGPSHSTIYPVYGGSAKTGEGVRELLDLVCFVESRIRPKSNADFTILSRREDSEVGKYFVLYSQRNIQNINLRLLEPENLTAILRIQKSQLVLFPVGEDPNYTTDSYLPGQELVLEEGGIGLKIVSLPKAEEEEAVFSPFSMTLEPEESPDKEFWLCRLKNLEWEDPGYKVEVSEETGQMNFRGRGELHLDVGVRRILESTEKKLQISVINIAKFERFKKMSHKVALEHSAFEDQRSSGTLIAVLEDTADFSKQIAFEVSLPEEVKHLVETAFVESALRGFYEKEVLGLKLRVLGYHPPTEVSESTLTLLKVAVVAGVRAMFQNNTELIGPLTEVEVVVDASHLGVVLSDLNRRHAKIVSIEEEVAGKSHLKANASAENMLGFSGALRNMTKGIGISWERTAFTSEFYAVLKE